MSAVDAAMAVRMLERINRSESRVSALEAALRQSRCSVCGRDWVPNLTDEDDVPPWCEVCGPARAALSPT